MSFFLLPCLSLLKHVHNFIPFRACSPEALLTLPDPPHRHITHVLYRRKSWLLLSPSSQVKHFILKLNLSLIECSTMFSPQKATLSSPTCINTDKGAFGNVIQATDTPALVLGLEELHTNLQAMLYQSVCAHVRVTFAAFVTLINSGRRSQ